MYLRGRENLRFELKTIIIRAMKIVSWIGRESWRARGTKEFVKRKDNRQQRKLVSVYIKTNCCDCFWT